MRPLVTCLGNSASDKLRLPEAAFATSPWKGPQNWINVVLETQGKDGHTCKHDYLNSKRRSQMSTSGEWTVFYFLTSVPAT